MKSRLSYFLILGIIILSFFIGLFFWRKNHLKEIPTFNEESFTAPISSKYIPIEANLVFHWKINPTVLPSYIGNYQDKINKNITNKKTKFIVDSSFKLISLDFAKDISKWVGDYGSFAIFDSNKKLANDWLIVLGVNKNLIIDEELESILNIDNLENNPTFNNKSSTEKSEIISKEINSDQSIYFITEKDHILISSNQEIIKKSIDQFDKDKLNRKDNYKSIQLKDNLNDGILLLEMSPNKIFNLIGQKENLFELNQAKKMISSLNIDKNEIDIEGLLSYDIKTKMSINNLNYNSIDINKSFEMFDDLILIDNPKQYFEEGPIHPYKKFIASIIKNSTTSDYSNLFKIILENSKGNLIWINNKDWVVLTRKSDTNKNEISNVLKKDNFLNSKLDLNNRNLEVWSKISTSNNEKYEIKENIEAIIEEGEGSYIWSQDLASILNFDHTKYLPYNLNPEKKTDDFKDFNDIIRIHLGKEKAATVLNNFYPYILFKTMLGNKLDFPRNIDISIAVPSINYPDFLKFKITLKTS